MVCAYVALYADRWPDRTTSYGDPETGIIVTPSLPAQTDPGASDPVRQAVQQYAARHPELVTAAAEAVAVIGTILDEAGINYLTIDGRAKGIASFAEKATRTEDGVPLYADPLTDIGDQLGVRVITYVRDDVEAVAALLGEQLPVLDDRDFGELTASQGRFGYASRHLQVEIEGRMVQVQLRTVLQHAWAEFEHDIRYKGTVPAEHASEFDRRFTLAAGLLELADQEFSAIRDRLRGAAPTEAADDDPRIAAARARRLPGRPVRRRRLVAHRPLRLDLRAAAGARGHHPRGARRGAARHRRGGDPATRMDYRYPPGAVRRLDDALLVGVRRPLRRPARQRAPARAAHRPARAAARELRA